MRMRVLAAGAGIAGLLATAIPMAQAPSQPQRPPVFRAGANFVLVDAYPQREGKIVEGLTAADFQVFEDGKLQAIESIEFTRVEPTQFESARQDPNSLNDMRAAAADPHNRVFVTFLDTAHTTVAGSHAIRRPLVDTLNRIVGPTDLFGVTTQNHRPQDLTLGRRRDSVEEQLSKYWTWGERQRLSSDVNDPGEDDLTSCFHQMMTPNGFVDWILDDGPVRRFFDEMLIERRREDRALTALEDLSAYLGSIREARTVLLVVSNGWLLLPDDAGLRNEMARDMRASTIPTGVVDPIGAAGTPGKAYPAGAKLTTKYLEFTTCMAEATRLLTLDQPRRYHRLIELANRNNVSVYPVAANGLAVFDGIDASQRVMPNRNPKPGDEQSIVARDHVRLRDRVENLRTIAENTDGIAVVETNDLAGGLRKIVDDVSAYYLLGYYSTNTKFDGKYRKIEVKMKTPTVSVHARRGYTAPTEARAAATASGTATVAAPAAVSVDAPLAVLGRLRDADEVFVTGAVSGADVVAAVELANRRATGPWLQGFEARVSIADATGRSLGEVTAKAEAGARGVTARVPIAGSQGPWRVTATLGGAGASLDGTGEIAAADDSPLLGAALLYRATPSPRSPLRPVADFQFRRTERVHIEWPILGPLDQRSARLLDRKGLPLAIPVALTERQVEGRTTLAVDVNLAPLGEGDFVIEVTASAGGQSDRRMAPLRVVR